MIPGSIPPPSNWHPLPIEAGGTGGTTPTVARQKLGLQIPTGGAGNITFLQSGSGAVARTVQAKERDIVSVADYASYGVSSSGNTTALISALTASNDVIVEAGIYNNVDISFSGKTLRMKAGVTFKLPNGTVIGGATSGPAVLQVSGANVTIVGNFTIDGNKANNDASSFLTSYQVGSLHISGANCRLEGTVTITDAYWRGFTVQNGDSSGNEVDTFNANCIKINSSFSYAAMFWTAKNFHIDRIEITRGSNLDARVRFGTQGGSTGQARDGYIGSIKSDSSVVFEAKAYNIEIGSVNCAVFKFQDATDCHVDKVTADYTAGYTQDQVDSFGIGFNDAIRCTIGIGRVTRFNCTTESAFTIGGTAGSGSIDCRIGCLFVDGTLHAVTDCRIITVDGLDIGLLSLKSAIATGFLFDTDSTAGVLQPQRRITIGALISIGHTTDVSIESASVSRNEQIKIDYINPDAVIAVGGAQQPYGAFSWVTGTASATMTCGFVTANSTMIVMPADQPAGIVVQTKGFYVTCAAGSFTIHTGDGTNTANTSNWKFNVFSPHSPAF